MYTEVVVPRKNIPLLSVLRMILGVLGALSLLVGIVFSPLLLPGALLVFGCWLTGRHLGLEFQYCLVEDELQIDKVIGNDRRKHLATVRACEIVCAVPTGSPEARHFQSWSTIDVSAKDDSKNPYVLACNSGGRSQKFILSMNDALETGLKRLLGTKFKGS